MADSPSAVGSPHASQGNGFARRLHRFLDEVGLVTIYHARRDTHLLIAQRLVRMFAYGTSALILVSYLKELGNGETKVGLFMTLTLIGDVVISFLLTLFADSVGRKVVLATGAALMVASGIVFALSGSFAVLLAAAILGVISPSGNEIGPFRAVEESTLAHLTPKEKRPDVFTWYSLVGYVGIALGYEATGWIIHVLHTQKHWDIVASYRVIFFIYAGIGVVKFVLACLMSRAIEADPAPPQRTTDAETAPLLGENGAEQQPKQKKSWLPSISKESRLIVFNLCLFFGLDSFASGIASTSWLVYFFKSKFDLQESILGSIFFVTAFITAFSVIVASSIAKRIGNVQTMVFTHLPSAICLVLLPIPSTLSIALVFLIIRSSLQSMDVAPRSAFLSAVVLPSERTAVMGTLNVVKTGAQSAGPLITGLLAEKGWFGVAFMLAGSCKIVYDLGMLAVFVGHKPREDEETTPS